MGLTAGFIPDKGTNLLIEAGGRESPVALPLFSINLQIRLSALEEGQRGRDSVPYSDYGQRHSAVLQTISLCPLRSSISTYHT